MKTILRRISFVILMLTALGGCNKHAGLQIGDAIPQMNLTDLQERSIQLPIKGKVTLLRFWSIDCDFCDKQMLLFLETLYQKYKDDGFLPLAINESKLIKTDERLKKFDRLNYPMLVDEYGLIAKRFGVIGLPTTFIIDGQGIVRDKITGEAGAQAYEKMLTTILYKGGFYENGH